MKTAPSGLFRAFLVLWIGLLTARPGVADLALDFADPPDADRPWVFWWWLDGAASKSGITRELEEMRRQGIGGVLLVDAGIGGIDTPKGPPFMSQAWRENFRHAVRETGRLGLRMSVNLCSGWNAGGPWVRREDAIKHLVTTEITVAGPQELNQVLPQPRVEHNWYRDIAVLACRTDDKHTWKRDALLDLTGKTRDGRLRWNVPPGRWTILRLGCTVDPGKAAFGVSARTKCSSNPDSEGWEVDPLSARAMDRHFAATAARLIRDAGPLAGTTLTQLHIDSWETVQPSWTQDFLAEFRKRRGYDALPFLPALADKTVDSPDITARFLWDYRRTIADLFAANYYGRLSDLAQRHGLGQDSESGGPFFFHSIDGLQCEGINTVPMGEFWKRNWEPDGPIFVTPEKFGYDTVRQGASAAHIYGRKVCAAEAFTSFAEDWSEDPWCLKDVGDAAFCNGLTRMVVHKFTHQPQLDAVPGYQWTHVGTHLNLNTTWWGMSHAWLQYLRRCQFMLRQGLFVADFAYYYGEDANSFVRSKTMTAPPLPSGFDCDTLNAEVLLKRASAKHDRLVLPDGMSYRYLVLPHQVSWKATPSILRKIAKLVEDGVTVIGPKPSLQSPSLTDCPHCDQEVSRLVEKIWGGEASLSGQRQNGKGRVIWGKTLAAVVQSDGLAPDVQFYSTAPDGHFDWIHRRDGEADIYFISNQTRTRASVEIAFRASGRQPELGDPVTGQTRLLPDFNEAEGRTSVPMRFEPRQSFFVIFRKPAGVQARPTAGQNFQRGVRVAEIPGPWEVTFDPKWGGPEKRVLFGVLEDWTKRPEKGIRFYSGTAVYRKTFDFPQLATAARQRRVYLDLGSVKNVAAVKLNGRDLGIVWTAPWRVDTTGTIRAKNNQLEIAVVNLWPNRLIGDAKLPPQKRFTRTNVKTYSGEALEFAPPGGCKACDERQKTKDLEKSLLSSGLLGPVTLVLVAD